MNGPIRKLESRVRHHEAIAALDAEAAQQAGDAIEEAELRTSSQEHAEQAADYLAAVRVLKSFQEMQRMIRAAKNREVVL